jgi:hypothetical protein
MKRTKIKKILTHLEKMEFGITYKRRNVVRAMYPWSTRVDMNLIKDLAGSIDLKGKPRFRLNFKKSGIRHGEETKFKHYCKAKSKAGSLIHIYFSPERPERYIYKAKIRLAKTNLDDLVRLAKFFLGCDFAGANIGHKIQMVEVSCDFYPALPKKPSVSEWYQAYSDLMHQINSRFLLNNLKDAFFSPGKGQRSRLVVSRHMDEWATYYQNERRNLYAQAKVYWKRRNFVRLETTLFRRKLEYEKIRTIYDLFSYNLVGLVDPPGRKQPLFRFLIPRRDRFEKTFWKHLDKSRGGRGAKGAQIDVGERFLAELVWRTTSTDHRPPSFYRDFFFEDKELTGQVLKSLKKAQREFDKRRKEIDSWM